MVTHPDGDRHGRGRPDPVRGPVDSPESHGTGDGSGGRPCDWTLDFSTGMTWARDLLGLPLESPSLSPLSLPAPQILKCVLQAVPLATLGCAGGARCLCGPGPGPSGVAARVVSRRGPLGPTYPAETQWKSPFDAA